MIVTHPNPVRDAIDILVSTVIAYGVFRMMKGLVDAWRGKKKLRKIDAEIAAIKAQMVALGIERNQLEIYTFMANHPRLRNALRMKQ